MIEMVQRNMGSFSDLNSMKPILFSIDAAAGAARRMLAKMIEAEQKTAAAA